MLFEIFTQSTPRATLTEFFQNENSSFLRETFSYMIQAHEELRMVHVKKKQQFVFGLLKTS